MLELGIGLSNQKKTAETAQNQQKAAEIAQNQQKAANVAQNQKSAAEEASPEGIKKTANLFALKVALHKELIHHFGDNEWIPGWKGFSLEKPFIVGKNGKGCNVVYKDVCAKFELLSFDPISLTTMQKLILAHSAAYEHLRRTNNTLHDKSTDLELNITVDRRDQIEALIKLIPPEFKIGRISLREGNKLTPIPVEEYVKAKPIQAAARAVC